MRFGFKWCKKYIIASLQWKGLYYFSQAQLNITNIYVDIIKLQVHLFRLDIFCLEKFKLYFFFFLIHKTLL